MKRFHKPWEWLLLVPMILGPATPYVIAAVVIAFVVGLGIGAMF